MEGVRFTLHGLESDDDDGASTKYYSAGREFLRSATTIYARRPVSSVVALPS